MSQLLVSPGVFTTERDLSFLPQGIAEIGAAFVGPTEKGPAFRPVIVNSQEEFTALFGDTTPDFYTPYAVQNYLREGSRATICRILGLSGYDNATVRSLVLSISGSGGVHPVGLLFPSRAGVSLSGSLTTGSTTPTSFTLTLTGSDGSTTYTSMSISSTSANYFAKILGTGAGTNESGFAYLQLPGASALVTGSLVGSGSIVLTQESGELMLSGSTYGTYREAVTPWIRSQLIGSTRYNLFRAHTLSDGNAANTSVKLAIANVRPDPLGLSYGTFTVVVRDFADTDSQTTVLEQFDNCTLDPNSPNYVARRIGTSRTVIDANNDIYLEGDWPNNSQYIYLEMDEGADQAPVAALPLGFTAPAAPLNLATVPAPNYTVTRYAVPTGGTTAVANNRVYYGFDFSDTTSLAYCNPIPSGSISSAGSVLKVGISTASGSDAGFDLLTQCVGSDAADLTLTNSAGVTYRKFTVPFQNGFDGQAFNVTRALGASITNTNTQGFDLSDSNADGAIAYVRAINALANPDAFDINMLVLPGVIYSQHSYVVTQAIQMCENRGDCFYILDSSILGQTVAGAVNDIEDLDTNYAGTYYPWIKIRDANTNKTLWVPPAVVMPNVFAFNDRVAAEWFAPAGLNRGGIDIALQVRKRLDQGNRDDLYQGRVNPIATFPGQGIVAWGQKTLQQDASALDRINVRRLLIAVKKFIASSSRYLVFEQNTDATRQRFLSIVNPYLQSVQERSGLYAFRVVMDDTNNTPDVIDRNVLVGQLYLKPTKTAEFISLQFNVLPTGATFNE